MEIASPTKLTPPSSINHFRRIAKRITLHEVICVTVLAMLMVGLWSMVYDVTSVASLNVPRAYSGDVVWNLALIKAYRDNDIEPLAFQNVRELDAPFKANWNDYPTSEKMLPYCIGILARFVGIDSALNLAGVIAMVFAAIAFYVACRILHYQWMFSFVGAVMFGFSHYMSTRFLYHLSLNYFWHIPLFLLVTWWCFDSKTLLIRSPRWWFATIIGVITGLSAIYYAFVFWQFLGFALLKQALRRNWPKVISIVSVAAISVGSTAVVAAPHVLYRILHGSNSLAAQRNLANLQLYGLELPSLFLPPFHRWKAFFNFGQTHYYQVSLIHGEIDFCYLGMIGIIGLLWLIGFGIVRILKGKPNAIPIMFWQSLWIITFSMIGGINLLVGISGLQLFRATNRFSIVLLCLGLFFLARQLDRVCPREFYLPLALLMLFGGLWDILPPFREDGEIQAVEKVVFSDRNFVQHLEHTLPAGAMVFQAPVMDFPEVPPHLAITDYTYLRPYLYSHSLRFSYGSDKGRPRELWQHEVDALPVWEMAAKLEKYGFGAILIDRKGYPDGGVSVLQSLVASGRPVIEEDQAGEFVALRLHPDAEISTPEIPPFPSTGFYTWEGDWRHEAHVWSQGNATLIFTNPSPKTIEKQYTFVLGTLSKRLVTVVTPSGRQTVELNSGTNKTVGPLSIQLSPGETPIQFNTDSPPVPAGGLDQRQLAFSVALLPESSPHGPVPVLGAGFYGWEGDWQQGAHVWSQGSATLLIDNPLQQTVKKRFSFVLGTTSKRHVTVVTPAETKTVELSPGGTTTVGPFLLQLGTGQTSIRFESDEPPVPAGPGDPRKIAFSLILVPGGTAE